MLDEQSIELEEGDEGRLGLYLAMLLEASGQFNLTAIRDPEEAWVRHVFDALTLLPYLLGAEVRLVVDVGPGGGVPGVPLAIALPAVRFTLLEATGKKARFLEQVASALDLANVQVVHGRAEEAGQDRKAHRERYDAAIGRAVGPLAVLAELTVPLVRVGGLVLAIKGRRAEAEIAEASGALRVLHCGVARCDRTPTGTVVVLEKNGPTPRIYPRRPGEPKRAPLGGSD
jgi:16S rRNA (guanine527-N7)-methyltransferase